MQNDMSRRAWAKLAGLTVAGVAGRGAAEAQSGAVSLFNGKTLAGWTQIENNATLLYGSSIVDPAAFVGKLTSGSDAVSAFLRGRLQDSVKADLAKFSESSENANAVLSALSKNMNQVLAGPSIYEKTRFQDVTLRPETKRYIQARPRGQQLARLNKLLLEDAYPDDLSRSVLTGWVVKDGAMASTGVGRGVIHTDKDYSRFRLTFSMRHVSGDPDHHACVLFFCTRPKPGETPLDCLGGIQFQVPIGGRWDYRPGKGNNGGDLFTRVATPAYDEHEWSSVEILADAVTGTARMAVAQPPGIKAVEVWRFQDAAAGKVGPIAWQMHNAGLFDEFKDVSIEADPEVNELITVR